MRKDQVEAMQDHLFQVAFGKESDLAVVEQQAAELVAELDGGNCPGWKIITGFLSKDQVTEMGWSTEIHDLFGRVFGEDRVYHMGSAYASFEDYMAALPKVRQEIAATTSRLYVLGTNAEIAPGVAQELSARGVYIR